eukprot:GDKI01007152.1.p1 GENE.GDKI01007152.1~~GDKI01007152.1.p1  ORF type:complete len:151 (-),score=35.72 GDKI01007152.1:133-585(-)
MAREIQFSKEHVDTFRENFNLLDEDKDDKLNHEQVAILFRAFGQNPTDEEMRAMLADVPQLVDFEGFMNAFKRKYKTPTGEAHLKAAFQCFEGAGEGGKMKASTFQELMRSILPPDEIEELLKIAKPDAQGYFDYARLSKLLCEGPKDVA